MPSMTSLRDGSIHVAFCGVVRAWISLLTLWHAESQISSPSKVNLWLPMKHGRVEVYTGDVKVTVEKSGNQLLDAAYRRCVAAVWRAG